jgi:hypothetical protein
MSNALTLVNGNEEQNVDFPAQRITRLSQRRHFPSYFGNFGNFIQFKTLWLELEVTTPGFDEEHQFALITAFMAIV